MQLVIWFVISCFHLLVITSILYISLFVPRIGQIPNNTFSFWLFVLCFFLLLNPLIVTITFQTILATKNILISQSTAQIITIVIIIIIVSLFCYHYLLFDEGSGNPNYMAQISWLVMFMLKTQ